MVNRFRRLVRPETMRTAVRGTARVLATKRINSSFAAPPTGGALSLILIASPWVPTTTVRDERGWT